ncbi:MBL fold metallo-hydrolase [Zhongshania arctica]|uniref:MBL fold metallo-hydrolase n=1 Tax=Zhongshania arctica TaxID=3238302 RepID=A0ABV3TZU7_9GAMM
MKIFLYSVGLIAVALAAVVTTVQIPSVQGILLEREVAQRASNIPEDLFVDDAVRVTLCGSAAPMPVRDRAAACVMVIAGGKYYIVDTGNRSTNNLALWRIPSARVGAVLLTHFHSDHIGDLGEFNMTTWAQGRPGPLTVYGPKGVEQVVEGFTRAYALDSLYRTAHHGKEILDPAVGKMVARELTLDGDSAVVLEDGDLKVQMFRVNHSPIEPAVGYRFDYKGRSVVVSGDTTKVETTIKFSQNADVLIHEGLARHIVKRMEKHFASKGDKRLEKIMLDIEDYHTSPIEAAEVANEANVKELVLYHLVPAPPHALAEWFFMRGVKDIRSAGVTLGYDGLTLVLPVGSNEIRQLNLDARY